MSKNNLYGFSIYKLIIFSVIFVGIIFYFDYKNMFYSRFTDKKIFWLIIIAIIIIIFLILIENKAFKLFKSKFFNTIDYLNVFFIISCSIYLSLLFFFERNIFENILNYKINIVSILLGISFFSELFRMEKIKYEENKNHPDYNLFDLKEIIEWEEIPECNGKIFIREAEVEYDLLGRKNIINNLYNTIIKFKSNEKFVVSLEGPWGSGKTTLINNVKKEIENNKNDENIDKIVLINDFDPWNYKDEKTMFEGFLNTLLKNKELGLESIITDRLISEIKNEIFNFDKLKFFKPIFYKEKNINDIKEKIGNLILKSDKRIIFFIDNIDRIIENKSILFLFNTVGNLLDIKNIMYILSFDNERIENIFNSEKALNYDYLKKIINLKITVPEFDKNTLRSLYKKTMENIIKCYKSQNNTEDYKAIIEHIISGTQSIRDFKRFINSLADLSENSIKKLYFKDLLIIKYIQFSNYSLYKKIKENKSYFISGGHEYDKKIYFEKEKKDFDANKKDFLKAILSENEEYKNMLYEIFGKTFEVSHEDISEIEKNNRISYGAYFDIYFTEIENNILRISRDVDSLIEVFNSDKDYGIKEKYYTELFFNKMSKYYYSDFFNRFLLLIDNIENEKISEVLNILYNNFYKIQFYEYYRSVRNRIIVIIKSFSLKINIDEFKKFLNSKKSDYNMMSAINYIKIRYCRESSYEENKVKILEDFLVNMCNDIVEKDINLYEDKYYNPQNIHGLINALEIKNNANSGNYIDEFKKYIKKYANKENIYRILYDMTYVSPVSEVQIKIGKKPFYDEISGSSGSKFQIKIITELFDKFGIDKEFINKHLEENSPETDDEKIIYDLFVDYLDKKDTEGDIEGYGIPIIEDKELKL